MNASKNGALKAVSEPNLRHPCLLHRSRPGASKAILLLISLDYLSALYQRQRVPSSRRRAACETRQQPSLCHGLSFHDGYHWPHNAYVAIMANNGSRSS
eukprot:6178765-Pleurochrysis_carterae.AAC.3